MNTKEYVKLSSDTNYIPIKYSVVEASIGTSDATSGVWLKCVAHGWDTESNYKTYLDSALYDGSSGLQIDTTGVQGTLGSYVVTTISDIQEYRTPATNHDYLPVG